MAKTKANKTAETEASVADYIKTIKEEQKRKDFSSIVDLIAKQTGFTPKMWGTAIVGCGSYHYKYDSGREGDAPLAALSSRTSGIVIYLSNLEDKEDLLKKLGKYKVSGGCVHIKKLEDIDTAVLIKLLSNSIKYMKNKYPG